MRAEGGQLIVNGQPIKVYSCRDPADIPWGKDKVDFVGEFCINGLWTNFIIYIQYNLVKYQGTL